jgi:translocation and assembly module TamB
MRGHNAETLQGDLQCEFSPSDLNGIALASADAHVHVEQGQLRATLAATATGGTLESELTADLTQSVPDFTASGRVPFPLIAHLAQAKPVATSGFAQFRIAGRGTRLADLQATATVSAYGEVAEVALDTLQAELRVAEGLVFADTVMVRTAGGWLAASGRIAALDPASAKTSDLRVRGELTNGAAFARALGLDTLVVSGGRVHAHVTGPARALALDAEATWDALQANDVHANSGQLTAHAELDSSFRTSSARVRAETASARAGALDAAHLVALLTQDGGESRFEASTELMGAQRAKLAGRMTADAVECTQLEVGSATHRWALTGPAFVRRTGERYVFEAFEMRSDSGFARLQGVLDRRQDSDLSLELRNLPLAAWTPLLGRPELAGRIDANVRLSGPAATPRVTGTSTVAIRAPWGPVGLLRTQLGWAGPRVTVEGAFLPNGASPLSVSAVLPYALSISDTATFVRETAERYDVRVTARNVAMVSLAPLLDPQSFLPRSGTIDADAHFEGTPGAMTGSGHIDVRDADLAIPELGARYRDVQIRTLVERDGLRIVSARAVTGKGSVAAKGVIRLPRLERPEFDVTVIADQFRAANSRDLSALVSGDLRIAGEAAAPEITGTITLQNSSVYLSPPSCDSSEVELTPSDWRMLEDAFGLVRAGAGDPARQFYEAARFGVDVKLAGDVWVRQRTVPRLEVELRGAFRFEKAVHALPRLTGRIAPAPDRGYVEQFARRFTFTGGEIMLNGDLADHQLDLKTEFKVPSPISSSAPRVVVHLDVQGTPVATRLILSSEPAMEQSEIVSFIISGQTTRERNSKSTSRTNMATALPLQLGLSQITAPLEEFAREKVGLDVVEVRQDGLQGATLVAGRFLDPRLYVGFRQPVAGRDPNARGAAAAVRTRFELEYSAFEWLVLNLQGESSRVRSFLRVSHAYR